MNNGNGKVDGFDVGKNSVKHTKKLRKLSKLGKSKSEKMFKSRNLAKSKKKLSKSRNLTNFDATKAGLKFLTSNAKTTFNRLWLAFIKALILHHFNLEYYIWIEIDTSSYAIGRVLSQLTSETDSKEVVTKINLG